LIIVKGYQVIWKLF